MRNPISLDITARKKGEEIFVTNAKTKVLTDKSDIYHEKNSLEKKIGNNGSKFAAISKHEEEKKLLHVSLIDSIITDLKIEENRDSRPYLHNNDNNLNKKNILKSPYLLTEPSILDQNIIKPHLNQSNSIERSVGAKSLVLRN